MEEFLSKVAISWQQFIQNCSGKYVKLLLDYEIWKQHDGKCHPEKMKLQAVKAY